MSWNNPSGEDIYQRRRRLSRMKISTKKVYPPWYERYIGVLPPKEQTYVQPPNELMMEQMALRNMREQNIMKDRTHEMVRRLSNEKHQKVKTLLTLLSGNHENIAHAVETMRLHASPSLLKFTLEQEKLLQEVIREMQRRSALNKTGFRYPRRVKLKEGSKWKLLNSNKVIRHKLKQFITDVKMEKIRFRWRKVISKIRAVVRFINIIAGMARTTGDVFKRFNLESMRQATDERSGKAFDKSYYRATAAAMMLNNDVVFTLSSQPRYRSPALIHEAADQLRSLRTFSFLPVYYQIKIASIGWYLEVPKDKVIIREGQMASSFYIVMSGKACSVRLQGSPLYKQRSPFTNLDVFHRGDMFGEESIHDRTFRSYSVVAVEPCVLLSINLDDYIEACSTINVNDTDSIPDHIRMIGHLDFMKFFPMKYLWEEICEETIIVFYYRAGFVITRECSKSKYIFIVKSGACEVVAEVFPLGPQRRMKSLKVVVPPEADDTSIHSTGEDPDEDDEDTVSQVFPQGRSGRSPIAIKVDQAGGSSFDQLDVTGFNNSNRVDTEAQSNECHCPKRDFNKISGNTCNTNDNAKMLRTSGTAFAPPKISARSLERYESGNAIYNYGTNTSTIRRSSGTCRSKGVIGCGSYSSARSRVDCGQTNRRHTSSKNVPITPDDRLPTDPSVITRRGNKGELSTAQHHPDKTIHKFPRLPHINSARPEAVSAYEPSSTRRFSKDDKTYSSIGGPAAERFQQFLTSRATKMPNKLNNCSRTEMGESSGDTHKYQSRSQQYLPPSDSNANSTRISLAVTDCDSNESVNPGISSDLLPLRESLFLPPETDASRKSSTDSSSNPQRESLCLPTGFDARRKSSIAQRAGKILMSIKLTSTAPRPSTVQERDRASVWTTISRSDDQMSVWSETTSPRRGSVSSVDSQTKTTLSRIGKMTKHWSKNTMAASTKDKMERRPTRLKRGQSTFGAQLSLESDINLQKAGSVEKVLVNPMDSKLAKPEPVSVTVKTLYEADMLGFEYLDLGDVRDEVPCEVSLVSDGAEVIMISREFFMKHATPEMVAHLRWSSHLLPSHDALQVELLKLRYWNRFREQTVKDVENEMKLKKIFKFRE